MSGEQSSAGGEGPSSESESESERNADAEQRPPATPGAPASFAEAAEVLAASSVPVGAQAGSEEQLLSIRARDLGQRAFVRRQEAGVTAVAPQPVQVVEFHVCAGLNACHGHDSGGTALIAGAGVCATAQHVCHGAGACRGQGGCGYSGSAYEQAIPAEQACSHHGSCAAPINECRVSTMGPNRGKSVWKLARKLFEARMFNAEVQFQPAPQEGSPDDLVPGYVVAVPGVLPLPLDPPGSICRVPHPDGLAHDPASDANLCRATRRQQGDGAGQGG
ncbi:MAG TPA: hypothetical protein VHT30_05585 [Acidimicrobiales bacterium]|jgi:hypothetical protein|nr:hypothetical protein [Acidimicrobiales bacterium]